MILWASWALKNSQFGSSEQLHQLIEWCFEHESVLQADGKRRDVISIMLQNYQLESKSKNLEKILVKCCGDEFYSYLEQYVLYLESLNVKLEKSDSFEQTEIDEINQNYPQLGQRVKYFTKVLEKNELYKLVSISSYSKMSVITALRSNKRAIKLKGLELLESTKSIESENIQSEVLEILDIEDDPAIIQKILEFQFFTSKTSKGETKLTSVLLKKFVSIRRTEI